MPRLRTESRTSCAPLTAEGRHAARELGERLAADGVRPDAVLTSPLLRARETGAELARAAGSSPSRTSGSPPARPQMT